MPGKREAAGYRHRGYFGAGQFTSPWQDRGGRVLMSSETTAISTARCKIAAAGFFKFGNYLLISTRNEQSLQQ